MTRRSNEKRSLLIKIFCLCAILTCVFGLVSCSLDGSVQHKCLYAGSNQLNTSGASSFVTEVESARGPKVITRYLGQNVTLSDTLTLNEGVFVGICTSDFTLSVSGGKALYTVVDTNKDGVIEDAGVFTFKCGAHAYHSKHRYEYVEQSAVDFYGRSGASLYDRFSGQAAYISLNSNLHISEAYTSFIIPAGKTLNVCTNGYDFTYDLDLEAYGGKLSIFNCRVPYYHECLHLNDDAPAIDQSMMAALYEKIAAAQPGDELHAYLKGDISWTEELVVPEGVTLKLCLNSYSATGPINRGTYTATVQNPETGLEQTVEKQTGAVAIFDCSHHLCSGVCTTGEMLAFSKNSVNWVVDTLTRYVADPASPETIYCVLEDDVDIPLIEGVNLVVCVNGFKNRTNETLTDASGNVTGAIVYHNCASAHICEIASMVGLENRSVLFDTAEGVNLSLSQLLEVPEGGTAPLGYACFSLTADLKGTGEIKAPEGTFAVLCLNGYSMGNVKVAEGGNVILYECGKEYCSEMKNDVLAIDQGIINILTVYAQMTGSPYPLNANYIYALSEDIVVPPDTITVGEGFTVNFCTRGHTVTGLEGMSGVITHKGCTNRTPDHICAVPDMLGQSSTPIKAKSAGGVNEVLSNLRSGIYFYHLTDNLTGTGELVASPNAVVGICLDGFSQGDVTVAPGSNIFFYECGKYYCPVEKINIPTLDQGVFDFLAFCMMGEPFEFAHDVTFGISENVNVPIEFKVAEGNTVKICTGNYSFNSAGTSGNLIVHKDVNQTIAGHACSVVKFIDPRSNSTPLYAMSVAEISAAFARDAEKGFGIYHLTSDIIGGGTLVVPESFIGAICLNGFSIDDVEIPEGANVLFYECGRHYCQHVHGYIDAFDQGALDLFAFVMKMNSGEDEIERLILPFETSTAFALIGDVHLPFDIIVADGHTLDICTCGSRLTYDDDAVLVNVAMHDTCTYTKRENLQTVTESAGGCPICSAANAKPLNYATLREMMDHNGNIILPSGSYYYYLENDFQLTRTLLVPTGIDLHICLHGYTLYSAYLWSDSATYGGGFPEAKCSSLSVIEPGAVLNIYDCSEKMTGSMALRQFRMRNEDTGRMSVAFYVVEEDDSSSDEGLDVLLSSIMASIAINQGTVNIYGGNMYSVSGFINTDGAVLNIYNGNLYSMFTGVINIGSNGFSLDLENSTPAEDVHIYVGEGATISSIYAGILASGGDVVLDGGTINAGTMGIAAYSSDPNVQSSITINGGEVNVGSSDRLMASSVSSWSSMGGEVLDFAGASLDMGYDQYVGVMANQELTINSDVNIVMGEMTTSEKADDALVVDFMLVGDLQVNTSDRVTKKYTLAIENEINAGKNDVFVPDEDTIKYTNPSGEIVIVPIDGEFVEYAKVSDMSVSTEGAIKVNIYTEIDPVFAATGRVRFCVEYGSVTKVYTLDDAEIVTIDGVTKYKFSISTAAKDYATEVNCYFTFAPFVPTEEITEDSFGDYVDVYIGSQRLSIQSYLNKVISNRAYGDDTILLAKAMKNYCAAAAYHFEVAENYAVVEGMGPYLNEVTVDILEQFKPSKGEAYSVAPLNFKMATVVLESETSIRVYFSLADGYTVTTDADGNIWLSGEYNGQQVTVPITATLKGSDTKVSLKLKQSGVESRPYCLEISGICAKDYFTMYSIKIMDTEYINYSVAGYARTVLSNPNKYSEDVVDVVKAMMVYGYAANEYFNNSQGE